MKAWPAVAVPALGSQAEPLRLYDTAAASLRPVGPATGSARLYVCGITPYDATHLGHAFTYLTFDLVNRQWRDRGLSVAYTQNITDVDDPLLERAALTGVDWQDLAADQIELFRTDMAALRILPPDHYCGVVESLPLVTGFITELVEAGAVYQVDDPDYPDWYFAAAATPDFGAVAHLDRTAMLALFAERGGDPTRPGKRDPLDALVWRLARPGEPHWDSPLGPGRPGWHIECTAIAQATLGPDFDLQGGGADLPFPHHEMCAAQARWAGGRLAQAYTHVALVGLDGEKMSKSKGNLVLVSQLRAAGADPMAIRLALLAHHYRTEWSWTDADLTQANTRLARWRAAVEVSGGVDAAPVLAQIRADLADDLHCDRACARIDQWADTALAAGVDQPSERAALAAAVDALLGVDLVGESGHSGREA